MIDLTNVKHHPVLEEIVDVLCNKTQNTDRGFFRTEVVYFFGKMASSMRAFVSTKDRGDIPVNMYTVALATSGYGKGHSVNIMENEFLKGFKKRFMEETMTVVSDGHMLKLAQERAIRNQTDDQAELEKIQGTYKRLGAVPFTYDSGTAPAVKQLREKLLIADCGSMNLQIDEIGSNLLPNMEVVNLYLELYDQGTVKQKLIKNTADNQRGEEMDGKTPANMLMFGTPTKLLDGGATEDEFYSMLDTGYARRCIYSIGSQDRKAYNVQTAAEIYHHLTQPTNNATISKWAAHFSDLADPDMHSWRMEVDDPIGIMLLEYKIACERASTELGDHEDTRKAELEHRYFKALKLAGAYAFIDQVSMITEDHLKSAILLVEESGEAFKKILNREKTYVKLARYLASVEGEQTHADLMEKLPFYKSGDRSRKELMDLATAWGYRHHIVIKKTYNDGIEFYQGETLKETNLDEMIVSYSESWAYNFMLEKVPFDQLHVLAQAPGHHWCNHGFKNQHRLEENALLGFNMLVLDVDEGVTLDMAHELMKDFKFMTYTTKRHTEEANRFRMLLPINYILELSTDDYKEFMNQVLAWIPFPVDDSVNQRAKKWESFEGGDVFYNEGNCLVDALQFIPKTAKNDMLKSKNQELMSLDNLERWFALRISEGNRNKEMLKYALALVDGGYTLLDVNRAVLAFNKKISNSLPEKEIESTILVTVAKRYLDE